MYFYSMMSWIMIFFILSELYYAIWLHLKDIKFCLNYGTLMEIEICLWWNPRCMSKELTFPQDMHLYIWNVSEKFLKGWMKLKKIISIFKIHIPSNGQEIRFIENIENILNGKNIIKLAKKNERYIVCCQLSYYFLLKK